MQNKKQLNSEIETLNGLKTVVESYEEIAAMRMRRVKKSVLQNREFLSGLNDTYQRVMYTFKMYAEKKNDKMRKKRPDWIPLETNGKTVTVLISANAGLYGDIVKKTFDLFVDNIKGANTDLVIVGKIGRQLMQFQDLGRQFKYFEIGDMGVDIDKSKEILDYILNYTNIIIYHGIFVSILRQDATRTFITGKALDLQTSTDVQELKCIIEPSVEEVTKYFEKQILASIFEQTMYESSLSKFASRMVSMDYASENIGQSIRNVSFQRLKLRHVLDNNSQIERMSGATLWK
jgi:ATP synthase F1 gamma subunit